MSARMRSGRGHKVIICSFELLEGILTGSIGGNYGSNIPDDCRVEAVRMRDSDFGNRTFSIVVSSGEWSPTYEGCELEVIKPEFAAPEGFNNAH